MKNIFITFFILLTLIFASSFGFIVYKENQYILPDNTQIRSVTDSIRFSSSFIRETKLKDLQGINSQNVKFNAWIPSWAMDSGIRSFEENKTRFSSISPVFYVMQEDGSINTNTNGLQKLQTAVAGTNVKLVPTISSFDPQALSINLNNPTKLNNFLIDEVTKNNYDGLDLNYESTYLKDKDAFFSHLKFLSTELKKRGKVFYVTVLSKWGDNINYGFAPETRKVQDYSEIAKYTDQIRIMTYDFTSQGSANAGPIAPIEWMERVLVYATNRVPPAKLSLGVNLYGYFWNGIDAKATALDYKQIAEIINLNSSPDTFYSEKNQESTLKYIGTNGKTYFGYYSSPKSIQARIDLAAKYGVTSVAFWRLGNDPL